MVIKYDCENNWGCTLVLPEKDTNSDISGILTGIQEELQMQKALQDIISSSCAPFELVKVEGCGSDANMYTINGAINMCPQQCAVACGSYLSANRPLRTRSSSALY
jgi:hypothetical protein